MAVTTKLLLLVRIAFCLGSALGSYQVSQPGPGSKDLQQSSFIRFDYKEKFDYVCIEHRWGNQRDYCPKAFTFLTRFGWSPEDVYDWIVNENFIRNMTTVNRIPYMERWLESRTFITAQEWKRCNDIQGFSVYTMTVNFGDINVMYNVDFFQRNRSLTMTNVCDGMHAVYYVEAFSVNYFLSDTERDSFFIKDIIESLCDFNERAYCKWTHEQLVEIVRDKTVLAKYTATLKTEFLKYGCHIWSSKNKFWTFENYMNTFQSLTIEDTSNAVIKENIDHGLTYFELQYFLSYAHIKFISGCKTELLGKMPTNKQFIMKPLFMKNLILLALQGGIRDCKSFSEIVQRLYPHQKTTDSTEKQETRLLDLARSLPNVTIFDVIVAKSMLIKTRQQPKNDLKKYTIFDVHDQINLLKSEFMDKHNSLYINSERYKLVQLSNYVYGKLQASKFKSYLTNETIILTILHRRLVNMFHKVEVVSLDIATKADYLYRIFNLEDEQSRNLFGADLYLPDFANSHGIDLSEGVFSIWHEVSANKEDGMHLAEKANTKV